MALQEKEVVSKMRCYNHATAARKTECKREGAHLSAVGVQQARAGLAIATVLGMQMQTSSAIDCQGVLRSSECGSENGWQAWSSWSQQQVKHPTPFKPANTKLKNVRCPLLANIKKIQDANFVAKLPLTCSPRLFSPRGSCIVH